MPSWLTVLASGLLTAAPQFLPLVPHSAQAALSGMIAIAAAAFHLYSPVPEAAIGKTLPPAYS